MGHLLIWWFNTATHPIVTAQSFGVIWLNIGEATIHNRWVRPHRVVIRNVVNDRPLLNIYLVISFLYTESIYLVLWPFSDILKLIWFLSLIIDLVNEKRPFMMSIHERVFMVWVIVEEKIITALVAVDVICFYLQRFFFLVICDRIIPMSKVEL